MRLSKTETEKTFSPWKLSKTDFSGADLQQQILMEHYPTIFKTSSIISRVVVDECLGKP